LDIPKRLFVTIEIGPNNRFSRMAFTEFTLTRFNLAASLRKIMDLHQIQVAYQQDDDRILVRTIFNRADGDPLEFRAWFTRRFVKDLWPGLMATLQAQVALNNMQVAQASAEIVNMENQAALNVIKGQGNFDKPFDASVHQYPLGELPILLTNVEFSLNPNQPVRIHFSDAQKNGLALDLTQDLLHAFCALLQQAVQTAGWEMDLQLPGTRSQAGAPRVLN
jgi:hypothetical protein